MRLDIGPQYKKDDLFKAKARLHQSIFRAGFLRADYKDYGNRLAIDDALLGMNFYLGFDGLFDEVKARYPLGYTELYYDMLRSEHIPFNLFIPLKQEKLLGAGILNHFLGNSIDTILRIYIEYVPKPKENYLNDKTAFDVFIEYKHIDGSNGCLGIEVKYTEQEYPCGKKEQLEISNELSIYNQLTKRIGIYSNEALELLKTPKYKQVWRNQLLGERFIEINSSFRHFTSLMVFPKNNTHFLQVCKDYVSFLKEEYSNRFLAITFEDFIEAGNSVAKRDSQKFWLIYLKARYIIID